MGGTTLAPLPLQGVALEQAARRVRWPQLSLPGSAGALIFACASFSPSLIPRDWIVQGVVNGLSATVGYAAGVFLGWLAHAVSGRSLSQTMSRRLWILLAAVGIPSVVWSMWQGQQWQHDVHVLTNVAPPPSYSWVRIVALTLAILVLMVGVGRLLRGMVRWTTQRLSPYIPLRFARPTAVVIVALLLVALNNEVVSRGLMTAANWGFGIVNGSTNPGTYRYLAPERSGSPESLITWESLGRQGRDFVGNGPSVAALTHFSGVPAERPVRIYAGLKSADTTQERASLAVRDLQRAGGFDRAVLVVATTTGTGLVDPAAAEALEYMYNGDTAFVALQYSYFPSWISFLADREPSEEAGRALFDQVYDVWAALPRGDRPKLLVTATSMGVSGSEAAFGDEADLENRVDGAVWAGPPNDSPLFHRFVEERDAGSPEWLPVYDSGRNVRFVSRPADAWAPGVVWDQPRIVYLQYGSDAVVRWTPSLAFSKPDWLSEPSAPDVSPEMAWIPVVTFWQVTADLPSMYGVPDGHGHRYSELYVDGWAAVAPPESWTHADTERLRLRIRQTRIAREHVAAAAGAE